MPSKQILEKFKILPGLILVILIGLVAIDYSNFTKYMNIMDFSEEQMPSAGVHLGDPEPQTEFLKQYKAEKHEYYNTDMGKDFDATEQGYNISLKDYFPALDFCVCNGRTHIKVSKGGEVRNLDSIGLMSYMISDDNLYLETDSWIIYKINLKKIFASSVFDLWLESRKGQIATTILTL